MNLAGIAIAGALGALARYGLDGLVMRRASPSFPWGTLVVNVAGAFVLGVVVTVAAARVGIPPWVRSSVAIGFLGAFTTFSTLSLETYRLLEDRSWGVGAANAMGSLVLGVVAVYAGVVVGRLAT